MILRNERCEVLHVMTRHNNQRGMNGPAGGMWSGMCLNGHGEPQCESHEYWGSTHPCRSCEPLKGAEGCFVLVAEKGLVFTLGDMSGGG